MTHAVRILILQSLTTHRIPHTSSPEFIWINDSSRKTIRQTEDQIVIGNAWSIEPIQTKVNLADPQLLSKILCELTPDQ